LENLATHVHCDFAGEVAVGHRNGDFGDVADLVGEVAGHGIHVVGQILPGARHTGHCGLATQSAFRTYLAGHAADFGSKGVQLVHHRVDRVLEFKDFSPHVHGDLARQVAVSDRRGYFGDVADLRRQIVGHRVDVVGQVFPGAGHALDLRLTT